MRICVMGDSHAAALRQGWSRSHPRHRAVTITFFAGILSGWKGIVVLDGRLVPASEQLRAQFARSSGGAAEVGGDFDCYMLCGLGLALSHPLRLWTHQERLSWEVYRAVVAAYIGDSACAHILPLLREITSKPVLILGGPHQPADVCKSSPLLDAETALRLGRNFDAACDALARAHGAAFVPQPAETLAPNQVTTKLEFTLRGEDRRHGNAAYGAIALANALSRCAAAD